MRLPEYRSTRDPHKGAHWLALGWGIVIAICAFVGQCNTAHADSWYVQGGGGCILSNQISNNDEIEFGSECGVLAAAEGGYTFDLSWLAVSLGGEAAHRAKELHGQNGHRKSTADGNTLHATSLAINARTERRVWGLVTVYGMAGVGAAYASGLGDSDVVPMIQAEGGLYYAFTDQISAGVGYRHAWFPGVRLDGNDEDLDFGGAVGWLRWSFGG